MEKHIPNYLKVIIMLIVGMASYFTLLIPETLVNPDAQFILPTISSSQGIAHYFEKLFQLQTLDVQPVRDLSLLVDLAVFNQFNINIFVFQNIIIWIVCCWFFYLITKHLFTKITDQELFLICLVLVVYPLIAPTVSWGVARKHLLSLMFALIATENWVRDREQLSSKDAALVTFYYLLSVLSQPISLLFPFWAASYSFLLKRKTFKSSFKFFVPAAVIFLGVAWFNYYYYENSALFRATYSSKLNEAFNFSDQVLALGHYSFQLFFPYLLSFTYSLGHWSTLVGLALAGGLGYLILGLKLPRKDIFVWTLYGLLPLSIIIIKPTILSDNYLIFPAIGFFIILIYLRSKFTLPSKFLYLYPVIILCWASFDYFESRAWKDEVALTQRGFERRTSCYSASRFLKMSYENEQPEVAQEAKKFLLENECEDFKSQHRSMFVMASYSLYYDDEIPLQKRLETLERISSTLFLHHMIWASLLIKEKQFEQANSTIEKMLTRWGYLVLKEEYSPIAAKVLYPYCVETKNEKCANFIRPMTKKPLSLYYK